jgi:NifU-like protein
MSLQTLTQAFAWSRYSKKLIAKIEKPRHVGLFTESQAEERGMRLAIGQAGEVADGNAIRFYWMVDTDDGIIVDAKFQVIGQSALIGAAEVAAELCIGKNYDQARKITAILIDKQVRDKADEPAFPKEAAPHLGLVITAQERAAIQCMDIPLSLGYVNTPAPADIGEVLVGGYPGWQDFSTLQKIGLIEEVIARDIRPYIELDAGGVEVKDLLNGREVIIVYQGSCTSCFSATGATLSYIQQVLKAKIHPDLVVIPDMTTLQR